MGRIFSHDLSVTKGRGRVDEKVPGESLEEESALGAEAIDGTSPSPLPLGLCPLGRAWLLLSALICWGGAGAARRVSKSTNPESSSSSSFSWATPSPTPTSLTFSMESIIAESSSLDGRRDSNSSMASREERSLGCLGETASAARGEWSVSPPSSCVVETNRAFPGDFAFFVVEEEEEEANRAFPVTLVEGGGMRSSSMVSAEVSWEEEEGFNRGGWATFPAFLSTDSFLWRAVEEGVEEVGSNTSLPQAF